MAVESLPGKDKSVVSDKTYQMPEPIVEINFQKIDHGQILATVTETYQINLGRPEIVSQNLEELRAEFRIFRSPLYVVSGASIIGGILSLTNGRSITEGVGVTALGILLSATTYVADSPNRNRINHIKDKLTEITVNGLKDIKA